MKKESKLIIVISLILCLCKSVKVFSLTGGYHGGSHFNVHFHGSGKLNIFLTITLTIIITLGINLYEKTIKQLWNKNQLCNKKSITLDRELYLKIEDYFLKLQEAWDIGDLSLVAHFYDSNLLKRHKRILKKYNKRGWKNYILSIEIVDITHTKQRRKKFSVDITFSAIDFILNKHNIIVAGKKYQQYYKQRLTLSQFFRVTNVEF